MNPRLYLIPFLLLLVEESVAFGQSIGLEYNGVLNGKPEENIAYITEQLPADYQLGEISWMLDERSLRHFRIPVLLHNYPIKGGEYTLHDRVDGQTRIVAPSIELAPTVWQGIKTEHSERLTTALNHLEESDYELENQSYCWVPANFDWRSPDKLILVEQLDLHLENTQGHFRVYVSTDDASLIQLEDLVCNLVPGVAETRYSGTQNIETTQTDNGAYILLDESRGDGIHTQHENYGDFYDFNNYWDNQNEANDDAATDLHWGLEMTYDWYFNRFNRNSFDNQGMRINAFMRDDYRNAFYLRSEHTATFGEGSVRESIYGLFDLPFTSLDVVGHEISHGMTDFSAGLIYFSEPGGLNEAYSDIVGVSIQAQTIPDQLDWRLGNDFSSQGDYFRDMADPESLELPSTYGGDYWGENLALHGYSSLANLWFYLLVEGGTGVNDLGYQYNVEAIGMDKAITIVYHAWTYYFSAGTDYHQAAGLSRIVATELYGCGEESENVHEAWKAVGLTSNLVIGIASEDEICDLEYPIHFDAFGEVLSIEWDFGDGNTSTVTNPIHTYLEAGEYNVQATGQSCSGPFSIQLPSPISVLTDELDCPFIQLDELDNLGEIAGCSSSLTVRTIGTDYPTFSSFLISEPESDAFLIRFQAADSENTDVLNTMHLIFYEIDDDGEEHYLTTKSLLALSLLGFISVNSNRLKVIVKEEDAPPDFRFSIEWECTQAQYAPVASFTYSGQSGECERNLRFISNRSTGIISSYAWHLNGELVSDQRIPTIILPEFETQYDLSLTVCNDIMCDTFTLEDIHLVLGDTEECTDVLLGGGVRAVSGCNGRIRDNAGDDVYDESETLTTITIQQTVNTFIALEFLVFDLLPGDEVNLSYRDPLNNQTNLYYYEQDLQGETLYIPSRELRITFRTHSTFNNSAEGLDIMWSCFKSIPPVADFNITLDSSCQNRLVFDDRSAFLPSSWEWFVNGELSAIGAGGVVDINTAGTYNVFLVACNEFGCDTSDVRNVDIDPSLDPSCLTNTVQLEDISNEILLYPNPSRESLQLKSYTALKNWSFSLYDQQGRLISKSWIDQLGVNEEYNFTNHHLPAGLYQLIGTAQAEQSLFSKRFIKID